MHSYWVKLVSYSYWLISIARGAINNTVNGIEIRLSMARFWKYVAKRFETLEYVGE